MSISAVQQQVFIIKPDTPVTTHWMVRFTHTKGGSVEIGLYWSDKEWPTHTFTTTVGELAEMVSKMKLMEGQQ